MENIFIAIVTPDKEYGRSLSLAMLNICRGFIIRIFSAEEFLAAGREYDLVLWDGEEVSQVYGGRIIYLAEKPSGVAENMAEKRFSIYKYSTAAAMVAAVFEIYEALTGRRAVNLKKQDVRLFAFASCSGGAGCTTVAMAVAQELCRFHGSKVLYLSFEELDSSVDYFKNEAGIKGTAVYLYELFSKLNKEMHGENAAAACPFLERHVVRDDFGVEAFAPSEGRNPLRELNSSEIRTFTASLIDSCRYDVIIMDVGSWLSKTGLKCLDMAEKICFVRDHKNASMREEAYFSHIMCNCGEDVLHKVIKVVNRAETGRAGDPPDRKESNAEEVIMLGICENITKEKDHIRLSLEGEFGDSIGNIAGKISEPANIDE